MVVSDVEIESKIATETHIAHSTVLTVITAIGKC
jgi:hypothetical protein